jgi:hypothetical protein
MGKTEQRGWSRSRNRRNEEDPLKLLFVTPPGLNPSNVYSMRWRRSMKLLLVSRLARSARAISTIVQYSRAAGELGHEIAVFGEKQLNFPELRFSLDVRAFDVALFIVYMASDFPDLPYLASLLDGMPKSRRVIIDCGGRYNETIRIEHDFNHLEKMDGHQGWEWIEAFQSVADRILQPTLMPRRDDVIPFLFHGFDSGGVVRPFDSAVGAVSRWSRPKKYGVAYVGNNWQRWSQIHRFLHAIAMIRAELGAIALIGVDWKRRPDWAVHMGIQGANVDPEFLQRLEIETGDAIPFTKVPAFLSNVRFSPIFQRPLFNELGLVTNRMFETFVADTIPLVMVPRSLAESIYGPSVRALLPANDIASWLQEVMRNPEPYWEAIGAVRQHLTVNHSYRQRLTELIALLER